ncbi:MAG: acetolactate synthase small subunit [Absicoccus sp.]|uniref:Acetolactate synthase small subunit n=1 Tax=Absicoccus intestinalis TaxID=2926319 RepID=A0ABU4WJC5_9FIRM|nr:MULTISPECIES: acetolactate synthase small subunit [unclassified Absicoccus]MDX8416657.1 acetolactate synthase small subunit [Absicoccus sp. CLA-KB-P134]MDY3035198.1 acetolactate synthase small subunit [Absicoccus sp.]
MSREVLSIFVENQSNVLTRIASLFGRRGFNIDSLTVSTTNDPKISRITVVFDGNDTSLSQIMTQTRKLEPVKELYLLDKDTSLFRELLLLKVSCDKNNRSGIIEIVNIYRGKIISLSKQNMIIELTGAPEKIDGLLEMLNCYHIEEICRTGITGISRKSVDTDEDE